MLRRVHVGGFFYRKRIDRASRSIFPSDLMSAARDRNAHVTLHRGRVNTQEGDLEKAVITPTAGHRYFYVNDTIPVNQRPFRDVE